MLSATRQAADRTCLSKGQCRPGHEMVMWRHRGYSGQRAAALLAASATYRASRLIRGCLVIDPLRRI